MFHYVGPYIFDRLITSLSCHTSVYVMHLSKKDLRSWLKGSLSWSKSECETVRPCILCNSCWPHNSFTFKPRISYALTWSECLRLPSKDHDPESVGTLLDGRIELLKSNKTSEFFHVFFLPSCLVTPCVFWQHSKDIECITSLPANTMETSLEHIANSQWNPVPILIFSIGN